MAASFNTTAITTMLITTDERLESSGEGITRTTAPGAKFWPVLVRFGNGSPMRATIRATNKTQAAEFAKNRHPHASSITVLPLKTAASWL
jgi:hypothetical protein